MCSITFQTLRHIHLQGMMMNKTYNDDENDDAPSSSSHNAHLLSVNHGADDFDRVHQVAPLVNNQVFSTFKSVEKKISCPETNTKMQIQKQIQIQIQKSIP